MKRGKLIEYGPGITLPIIPVPTTKKLMEVLSYFDFKKLEISHDENGNIVLHAVIHDNEEAPGK